MEPPPVLTSVHLIILQPVQTGNRFGLFRGIGGAYGADSLTVASGGVRFGAWLWHYQKVES
jgi:hypothetical protein